MTDAIKDLIAIMLMIGAICAVLYFAVIKQIFGGSETAPPKDYAYSLTVFDPDGRDVGRIRINGELTPKVRGFYLKDVESDMILDVRSDGSIRYYPGRN